jgi:PAS domain S-box-containing protein
VPKSRRLFTPRSLESLETLHWLYSVEQRSVIPIKWLVLLLAVALILIQGHELIGRVEIVSILGAYTVTNSIFTGLFFSRILPVRRFRIASYLSLASDLLFVSTLIPFTGGLQSDFYILFILLILRSAALSQNATKKFVVDLIIIAVYFGCVFYTISWTKDEDVRKLAFRLTLLFAVVFMSWFLLQVLASQQARIFTINRRLLYQIAQNREVLSSMNDAVMVFSPSLQLKICNSAAENLIAALHGFRSPHEPEGGEEQHRDDLWRTPPSPFRETKTSTWEEEEARYKFWSDFPPDLIAKPLERLFEEVRFREDRRLYGQKITLQNKKGTKISLIASVAELGKGAQERLGWLLLLRDISEYQSLEEQLLTSEKLAAVGTLAAGLAHELGNPLGIIKSCARYLVKKLGPASEWVEETRVIASESERCEKILRQLLAFASQDQLQIDDVEVKELIRKTINLVAYQASESIEIVFDTDLETAPCRTDDNLLTQALLNLLLNAVDSIEREGNVEVKLSLDAKEGYLISIKDNGCGMGKESLARLFEPFYTTKKTGTGLGLSITQRIIQRLEGTISVRSEPGHGTIIFVALPRRIESGKNEARS